MAGSVIVTSSEAPADVFGSHGGSSVVQWQRLAVAGFVDGVMDSFDYNRVAPGAVIGLHTHHVTEEIYVVLTGTAEVFSPTTRLPIGPGDVALMGRGGSHGLVNDSDEPMEFLVVEATPPSTLRALYAGDATTADPDRSALVVKHLDDGEHLALGGLLNAQWGTVEFHALHQGEEWVVGTAELEYAAYVIEGTGRVGLAGDTREVGAGTALVFTRGTEGHVTAGPVGLRMVVISTGADHVRSAALAAETGRVVA